MGSKTPARWLAQRVATGVKDLPGNTAWVISKALPRPVEKAAGQAKDSTRRMSAAVKDAVPAGSDSVETRLKRAREATDRAQHAEEEALAHAATAKSLADEARSAAEDARQQLRAVKSETAQDVKHQIAEAQRKADEEVAAAEAEARERADGKVAKVTEDVNERVVQARERAEAAQEEARTRITDATAQMAQARRLADEAAEAARAAAAEAQQRADALSAEAQRQAGARTNGVAEAEKVQQKVARTAAKTTNRLRTRQVNGDPKAMTKNELMDLAVSLGVDGRRSMNKKQLVAAVNRGSRKRR